MRGSESWVIWGLCIALGILGGLGGYTFRYAAGLSYLSNDPKACMNCHIMRDEYDSWVRGSHHTAATCNDCHVPHTLPEKYLTKMLNGWNHSRGGPLHDVPPVGRPHGLRLGEASMRRVAGYLMAMGVVAVATAGVTALLM